MAQIFISYASKDQATANDVRDELERRGLPCWIASRDIKLGDDYQQSIVSALQQADVMLVLLSQHANASVEMPKEMSLGGGLRKPIIPARLEDVAPTGALAYQLAHAQYVDLFHDRAANLDRLSGRLCELLKMPRQTAAPLPARNTAPSRRVSPMWVGSSGLAAALATMLVLIVLHAPRRIKGPPAGVPSKQADTAAAQGPLNVAPREQTAPASHSAAVDAVAVDNTEPSRALRIKLGTAYTSRFQNNETAYYYAFGQPADSQELTVRFRLFDSDPNVKPVMSVYDGDGERVSRRFPEAADGAEISWQVPMQPGNYVLEVGPAGTTGDSDRFRVEIQAN